MSKLQELNKVYEEVKGKELACIILEIHMPTGETESIVNPNVEEKIKYINKTYNQDLIHPGCKDIYITDYIFCEADNYCGLGFGETITALQYGNKVARKGWNGKGMWVELQMPDEHSKMTRPYIYMCVPKGSSNHFGANPKDLERIPWLPSQTDILAEDWEIVE